MKYKKNDIVRFVSNQPSAHVIEMFGHYQGLKPEDATAQEYLGRVKSVIGNGRAYVVSTISDLRGFICILNPDEIVGLVDVSELTSEEKEVYDSRCAHLEAPNVYDNDPSDLDSTLTVEQKCEVVATKAMFALFPEAVMKGFENYGVFDFRMEKYLSDLDWSIGMVKDRAETRQEELRKKRDELASWFRKMRFKEYYTICLGVEEKATDADIEYEQTVHEMLIKQFVKEEADRMHSTKPETVVNNWLIAIDLNFEEVSIMRNGYERSNFHLFLAREHDWLYKAKMNFAYECRK